MIIGLVKFGLVIFIIYFVYASVKDDKEIREAAKRLYDFIKSKLNKKEDDNRNKVQQELPKV